MCKTTSRNKCCQCEVSIPCLDSSQLGTNDCDVIEVLDITFIVISHIAKMMHRFDKDVCFILRIWAGYVTDAVELIIISVNAGGINFGHWFGQFLFGAYVLSIAAFALMVSLLDFCCHRKVLRYWMQIFITFKLTSFINAMFIFIHPIVIFNDDYAGYEIFIMIVAVLDMLAILAVLILSVLVYGKCLKRKKRVIKPLGTNVPGGREVNRKNGKQIIVKPKATKTLK